jgi:NAD(P)-dependent dehydrogenase (short-subunit alcohol dehydrogenase family)
MDEVRKLAENITLEHSYINIIILNAGTIILDSDLKAHISQDGVEMTFAVNVFSHYLLTCRLFKLLLAAHSFPSRLLFVSSDYQVSFPVDWWNVVCNTKESKFYDGTYMYQASKAADAMLTYYFASCVDSSLVTISTFTPGIVKTNLIRKFGFGYGGIELDKADDEFWLATFPLAGIIPNPIHGKYFSHRRENKTAKFTYDIKEQQKLIELCEKITKEHFEKV